MNQSLDRLYNLLPTVYRQRDVEQGYPLRALLQVIAEQVNLLEADIEQLYENWFIETCEDWVVPYLGELIGYRPVFEAGETLSNATPRQQQRYRILIPRREVANTIRYRRRKGTLALLEDLGRDITGWPARAVAFYKLLSQTQSLNHLRLDRGQTVDLRQPEALARIDSPFDSLAHTVDVRRISSPRRAGRYNLPHVGLFVWPMQTYTVTRAPGYCLEQKFGPEYYTFSVLGNDTPLYRRPRPELNPTGIAGEENLPGRIRRQTLAARKKQLYGPGKSLHIWDSASRQPIPPEAIVVTDLSNWERCQPNPKQVLVDPELGRILFHYEKTPSKGIWVTYQYAFSDDIGGGEYERPLIQPKQYQVGEGQKYNTIDDALTQWDTDKKQNNCLQAVIEISDSRAYKVSIDIDLPENQSLQLRAANRTRPVIRQPDSQTYADALTVIVAPGSHFTLDGLSVAGRGVRILSQAAQTDCVEAQPWGKSDVDDTPVQAWDRPANITIRHSTLVPGWSLEPDSTPNRANERSLELFKIPGVRVNISHSILGTILVNQDEANLEPTPIHISDSILDATSSELEALSGPYCALAHVALTVVRSTVFGTIYTHAIDLGENSIFDGLIKVGRRQRGCIRFSYVPAQSRTPRRYNCQPDLVLQAAATTEHERESNRVHPRFESTRYGSSTYAKLSQICAQEITRGADDQSEMGVFHDLYLPQRIANLQVRLEEYTPAGMDVGIIIVN